MSFLAREPAPPKANATPRPSTRMATRRRVPVDGPADEEIIRRVQQGEVTPFTILFDRYYHRLERFVRHLGVPEADLDDVLSETFIRAFSRAHSFDPNHGARYVSYLYTIARNLSTDRLRERGRTPEMLLIDDLWSEPDPQAPMPEQTLLHRADVELIRKAMCYLSPSDREIITLSYDREMTCREIMEVMKKPSVTAVTTHLYKAMKRLRELVHNSDTNEPAAAKNR
jgi:RNA polymerase sigma-70 factor, ECF subfamily